MKQSNAESATVQIKVCIMKKQKNWLPVGSIKDPN